MIPNFSILLFIICTCSSVVSIPYSRSRSRWHGHRVCDVAITVEGPVHRKEEVQKVLCSQDNFSSYANKEEMHKYDADDESENRSTLKLDANSAHCSDSVADCILIDSDSETRTDVTVVNSDTTTSCKEKLEPTSSDETTPIVCIDTTTTPTLRSYLSSTSSADTTPLVTPPVLTRGPVLKRRRYVKNIQLHQDHSPSTDDTTPILRTSRPWAAENNTPLQLSRSSSIGSSDTTPLVTPPKLTPPVLKRRHTKQPRKLFTATDNR